MSERGDSSCFGEANLRGGRRVSAHPVDEQLVEAVGKLVGVTARLEPCVGPVRRGEREQGGRRIVEVGAQLAEIPALPEEGANPLLVAPPLAEDLVAALALEVAPLLDEHGRD